MSCSHDSHPEHNTDDEDQVIANISKVLRSVPSIGRRMEHLVLFGRG